jgi:hypothetical protein
MRTGCLVICPWRTNWKFDEAVKELKIVRATQSQLSEPAQTQDQAMRFPIRETDHEAKKYFQAYGEVKGIAPDYEKEGKRMVANCDFAKEAVEASCSIQTDRSR